MSAQDPSGIGNQQGSRAGSTYGRYRLLSLLGRGGFGEVYAAEDTVMDRMVAVKLLAPAYSQNEAFRERLYREARAAGRLHDPHVVPIHQCGEIDGQLYIDMRLIKGTDLQAVLSQRGALSSALAVAVTRQIASALDAAHADRIVHRDVKPGNILLTEADFACLVDFGLANAATDAKLTSSGTTIGTFAYMAPERLSNAEVSHRADIYALACVLYECLTGSPPYATGDLPALITAHLTAPIPRPSQRRSEIPIGLDEVIARGMAKNPDERYATAGHLAAAAQDVLVTADQDRVETIMANTQAAKGAGNARPAGSAEADSSSPTERRHSPSDPTATVGGQRRSAVGRKLRASASRAPRKIGVVAAVAASLLIGGLVIAWHPWGHDAASRSKDAAAPSTTTELSAPSSTPTELSTQLASPPVSGPPSPTAFSPKSIDQILLTADHLSKVLNANFSDNPSVGGPGGLGLNFSSYGMLDHSQQVTPPSCVGTIFTGEHDAFADADPAAIKTQTFGTPYGVNAGTPHLLQQTAAVLASQADAQQFLSSSEGRWKACGGLKVSATYGYESGGGFILGRVAQQGNMITLGMASTNNMGPTNGADACQQAMAVRQNVVVEVRTCEAPDLTSAPSSPNLVWVVPDAEKIARAMLDNVMP